MAISNATYETQLLKMSPEYTKYTAGDTASLFKSAGFLEDTLSNVQTLNDVFSALNRITLNIVNISDAVDTFEIGDFGEHFKSEYGAATQRMAIFPMKPTSPQYRNISPLGANMQQFRVPKVEDRYFKVNFDFQNFYSISEFEIRQMFVSEYGISEFYAGFMKQMTNSYVVQKHLVTLEALNALINDVADPLQDTQKLTLTSWTTASDGTMAPTAAELKEFIQKLKKVVADMKATVQTGAYNQKKFETKQDISRLRLLCRVGIKDLIETEVLAPIFHDDKLGLPFEIIEVENFGGLVPQVDVSGTMTDVYPVYATVTTATAQIGIGEQIGWSTTQGATTATYTDDDVVYTDPNEKVLAVLADKGVVFEIEHNAPRLIAAPYNAAGLYVTNWFSAPGNEIHGDKLYTLVVVMAP